MILTHPPFSAAHWANSRFAHASQRSANRLRAFIGMQHYGAKLEGFPRGTQDAGHWACSFSEGNRPTYFEQWQPQRLFYFAFFRFAAQ